MSRRIKFTVGSLLIVCALAFTPQAQAAMEVSDAELDCIIVGGPVSECDDCRCPQCYDTVCGPAPYDQVMGFMCDDVDGYLLHENCSCEGFGIPADYCHTLTSIDCYRNQLFQKDPDFDCSVYHQPLGYMRCYKSGHTFVSVETTTSWDECTETSSNPHE